jgi:hypothetical protein
LPPLDGLSVHPSLHLLADDLVDQSKPVRQPEKSNENKTRPLRSGQNKAEPPRPIVVVRPAPSAEFVRKLEQTLGEIIREFRRREVTPLLERIARLEGRSMVEDRLSRGEPVAADEWLGFVERMQQPFALGDWNAAHSSWRGGRC